MFKQVSTGLTQMPIVHDEKLKNEPMISQDCDSKNGSGQSMPIEKLKPLSKAQYDNLNRVQDKFSM